MKQIRFKKVQIKSMRMKQLNIISRMSNNNLSNKEE